MKIAICVAGHMREAEKLQPNYNKFLNRIKEFGAVDVFVSTWDKKTTKASWAAANNYQDLSGENVTITDELVTRLFSPKKFVILNNDFYNSTYSPLRTRVVQDISNLGNETMWTHNGIIHGYKQFFCVHQVSVLKQLYEFEHNFKYDLVIRTRPDMFYRINHILKFNFSDVAPNCLYGAQMGAEIDDQFYYGDSDVMDKTMSSFLRALNVLREWNGEATAFSHLVKAHHRDVTLQLFQDRFGVLLNDPISDGVELLNEVPPDSKLIR